MKGYKTGGRQAGTPNKLTAKVKDKIGEIIDITLESINVNEFTKMEKIKLLQVLCQYALPKKREVYNDLPEDVPLFIDEPPTFLCFTSAEQKQRYDNATDEEKLEMEKELICD